MGGKLIGIGLAVSIEEYEELIKQDPANAKVMRPYIGGEDVNSSPSQAPSRYAIDFTDYTLDEARAWPKLLKIVEERVKPSRMRDNRGTYKTYWWKPGESGRALYASLAGQETCLVCSIVSKHLCFALQPTTLFFSHKLYVFAPCTFTAFAVLQSRIHTPWTWLLSSTLDTRLNYSASDCFDTFPFPRLNPHESIPAVEAAGRAFYEARARYMLDTDQGLTKTYNALKDPENNDPAVSDLRRLTEAVDRAVLDAYGWTDIPVPPYCPRTDAEREAVQAFEDEVIDRLYVLNGERAAEEERLGLRTGKKGKQLKRAAVRVVDADASSEPPDAPARKKTAKKATAKKSADTPAKKTAKKATAKKSAKKAAVKAHADLWTKEEK